MRIASVALTVVAACMMGAVLPGCQLLSGLSSLETQADSGAPDVGAEAALEDVCLKVDCGPNGKCSSINGAAACTCDPGYASAGGVASCININECAAATSPCSNPNAECSDTPGAFTCKCKPGFGGDGTTCNACTLSPDKLRCWQVFDAVGAYSFVIPPAVAEIEVLVWGGGGAGSSDVGFSGGAGGYAASRWNVKGVANVAGEVGGGGKTDGSRAVGGGGQANVNRGGGGGASRFRINDKELMVAGGGGGAGAQGGEGASGRGGEGGGTQGGSDRDPVTGCTRTGGAGTELGPGKAYVADAYNGADGLGGIGGDAFLGNQSAGGGGGGGGGYFGGAGGGSSCGGGGGSGYLAASKSAGAVLKPGIGIAANEADGLFYDTLKPASVGGTTVSQSGGNGRIVILW